jgi:hypothetical protein
VLVHTPLFTFVRPLVLLIFTNLTCFVCFVLNRPLVICFGSEFFWGDFLESICFCSLALPLLFVKLYFKFNFNAFLYFIYALLFNGWLNLQLRLKMKPHP